MSLMALGVGPCARSGRRIRIYFEYYNKRARVSLTLRLICGYLLRSLLPFLAFILWNITGCLNVQLTGI